MVSEVYTHADVVALSQEMPERGPLCACCKTKIPQFADLAKADESRVRHLISQGRSIMAMNELREATGCSLLWAKIWVNHGCRPKLLDYREAPCPYCGKGLRTVYARQCRHCRRNWHDPKHLRSLDDVEIDNA